jgi:hypothetical protein
MLPGLGRVAVSRARRWFARRVLLVARALIPISVRARLWWPRLLLAVQLVDLAHRMAAPRPRSS